MITAAVMPPATTQVGTTVGQPCTVAYTAVTADPSTISARRSSTEITIVLATPMPPTSSATAPRPSSRPVKVLSTAAWAASASEGLDTSTSLGCAGLAVLASRSRTASTAAGSVLVYTVVMSPSTPR